MRREVETLLLSAENISSFIEQAAIDEAAEMSVSEDKNLPSGERFNHYKILSRLGAGGMGEVYLAEDTKLHRRVALKLLPPSLSSDQNANRRLLREARAAAALDHPHICHIHEIAETGGRSFIVMQFCEGETLAQKIERETLNLRETLDLAIQIADALSNAHSHHIIHRDIKPANIIVNEQGQAKILDFGLAKIIAENLNVEGEAETAQLLSAANIIIGTPPYMSPEQVRGHLLDARSDIFSFGVLLYEMLSRKPLFSRESHAETISAVLNFEPPIAKTLANVPIELQRIVRKSLAKDKEERYQTAKDLLIDLRNARQELEFQNKFGVPPSVVNRESKTTQILEAKTTEKTQSPVGGTPYKKHAFIFGAAILLAAIGFGYWFFSNQSSKTTLIESIAVDAPKPAPKLYWQMTEAEQLIFIGERAKYIQTLIGDEPMEFDEEASRAIKVEVDDYVEEKDSLSQKPFEEGLRVIYGRASQYAPLIIRSYEARQVPPTLGLYQAMVESEYHDCLVSPIGSVGLFQFAPKTAAKYGLTLKDYCNVEKQADAAAAYMSDLTSDFSDGKSSASLVLFGYVVGENGVRDYLRQMHRRGIAGRSFWVIFRHQQDLQPPLKDDGKEYVPRFFAAAIIGETPELFELSTPPLTTLREKGR